LLIGLPESGFVRVGDPQEVITTQGLVANTRGGTITAQCLDSNNTSAASAGETELIVNSVGAVTAPQPQPVPR
jgi:hypothetical protein